MTEAQAETTEHLKVADVGWSGITKKAWETRRARMIAAGWVPPEQRPKPPKKRTAPGGDGWQTMGTIGSQIKAANYARKAAAGTLHVVEDTRMRADEGVFYTVCSCGERFDAADAEDLAETFNAHSWNARRDARRSPVLRLPASPEKPVLEVPVSPPKPVVKRPTNTRATTCTYGPGKYGAPLDASTCDATRGKGSLCAVHERAYKAWGRSTKLHTPATI